uniref:Uncharacterized protein n=1 Tax=Oreochromis niloticus TaxID=8128 RepID=A0A669BV75_ORENI
MFFQVTHLPLCELTVSLANRANSFPVSSDLVDRLRHQLLPVYTYDPSEEINEAEQEMLWREEDTRVRHISFYSFQCLKKPLIDQFAQITKKIKNITYSL